MGFMSGILTKVVGGVKTLVTNAQIGKAATANGYVQGVISPAQQAQNNSVLSIAQLNPLYLVAAFVGVILLIVAMFSKRK